MFQATTAVVNDKGIHCRPSAVIVKEMQDYPGDILIEAESGSADLKSILGLIALGLLEGQEVQIQVNGPNEEETGRRLVELFTTLFDFPDSEDQAQAKAPIQAQAHRYAG